MNDFYSDVVAHMDSTRDAMIVDSLQADRELDAILAEIADMLAGYDDVLSVQVSG